MSSKTQIVLRASQLVASLLSLFITGAHGHIEGTFLAVLKRSQPSILIRGLVRDSAQADTLSNFYGWTVTPVIGVLDDVDMFRQEAATADIVIQACGGDPKPRGNTHQRWYRQCHS